jgi:sugar phosphate isomerase/epimerase
MIIACSTSAFRTPLEPALRSIAAMGFRHVDLLAIGGWDHINAAALADDFETEAGRIERLLRETGLTPVTLNCAVPPHLYDRRDETANARRLQLVDGLARLMTRLGVKAASFYPGYKTGDRAFPDLLRDWVATFREMLAIAARHGVEFVVEPHADTPFESPENCRALFEAMPELRVAYDPSHFVHTGWPLEETDFIAARAIHAHVRDASREKLHARAGTGGLDMTAFARLLRRHGYDGAISIEALPNLDGDLRADILELKRRIEAAWSTAA